MCYDTDGTSDPSADSAADMWTACGAGNVYVNDTTEFRTTGLKTFTNLGSQANTDVQAARDAGSIFSLAVRETTNTSANEQTQLREYSDATNPPQLTITYTTPGSPLITKVWSMMNG